MFGVFANSADFSQSTKQCVRMIVLSTYLIALYNVAVIRAAHILIKEAVHIEVSISSKLSRVQRSEVFGYYGTAVLGIDCCSMSSAGD
jgi:hypothetical protein